MSGEAATQRIALQVQYLGTHFYGWQRQAQHRSVQEELEVAIASRCGHPVVIHGAGRTDTGVHASHQVAHFTTTSPIPAHHWREVLNNCLPSDVMIAASAPVADDWHARFSASWRRYRYVIWNHALPNIFWRPFSWQQRLPLDHERMADALRSLRGYHDLTTFRCAGSKRPHSWVTVEAVDCVRQGPLIWIDVQASGFLYRMMRLLTGALVAVGWQQLSLAEFVQLWQQKQYPRRRLCAPPQGLCLTGVGYPEDPFLIQGSLPHDQRRSPTELPGFPYQAHSSHYHWSADEPGVPASIPR